jgi:hypothetical protein
MKHARDNGVPFSYPGEIQGFMHVKNTGSLCACCMLC